MPRPASPTPRTRGCVALDKGLSRAEVGLARRDVEVLQAIQALHLRGSRAPVMPIGVGAPRSYQAAAAGGPPPRPHHAGTRRAGMRPARALTPKRSMRRMVMST